MSTVVDETTPNDTTEGSRGVYCCVNNQCCVLEAATNFIEIFNMSTTVARHEGRVQLEQSDMRLPMNMAKMAKGGCSNTAIEETQQLIMIPSTKALKENKPGVWFPGT
jgi:hypothetical protein